MCITVANGTQPGRAPTSNGSEGQENGIHHRREGENVEARGASEDFESFNWQLGVGRPVKPRQLAPDVSISGASGIGQGAVSTGMK